MFPESQKFTNTYLSYFIPSKHTIQTQKMLNTKQTPLPSATDTFSNKRNSYNGGLHEASATSSRHCNLLGLPTLPSQCLLSVYKLSDCNHVFVQAVRRRKSLITQVPLYSYAFLAFIAFMAFLGAAAAFAAFLAILSTESRERTLGMRMSLKTSFLESNIIT